MRLPIPTKAAKGRSTPLSPELLINMYAEQAPDGARSNVVVHGRPGFTLFSDISSGKIRGLYRTQADGNLYVVVDQTLYSVSSAGTASSLGTIGSSGRVFFSDSETELMIVAGANGYTYNSTEGLERVTDTDFPGATSITYLDGYFIFSNRRSGQQDQFFISDLLDGEMYDALDFATAERYPDNLVRVFADHSQLILFGTDSMEIWFNSGNPDFPFARAQGSVIDQGLGAAHSVEKVDESVIWLDNEGMVRRLEGNVPVRISTHAIEHQLSKGDWTNAYSWSYTMEGHQFYVLNIPAANLTQTAGTYVYDAATQLWAQWKSYELDYCRIGFYAYAFGKHIIGDVLTGKLYELSLDTYQENGDHLIADMHFPQIQNDGNRFIVHRFQLDLEVGDKGRKLASSQFTVSSFLNTGSFIFGINSTENAGKNLNGSIVACADASFNGGRGVYASGIEIERIFVLTGSLGQNARLYQSIDGDNFTLVNNNVLGKVGQTNDGTVVMWAPPASGLGTGQGRIAYITQTDSAYSDDLGVTFTVTALGSTVDNRSHLGGAWIAEWSKFFVVGSQGGGSGSGSDSDNQVSKSSDGITYERDLELAGVQSWYSLFYSVQDDLLVIGGRSGVSPSLIAYKEGANGAWTTATINFNGLASTGIISGIAKDPFSGAWLAVPDAINGVYFTSTDGKTWDAKANTLTNDSYIAGCAFDYVEKVFVALGSTNICAKYDGVTDTWTDVILSGGIQGMVGTSVLSASFLETSGGVINSFEEFNADASVMLRISSDTKTIGFTEPTRSMGKKGEYKTRVIWRRLGQHRTCTPIVRISDPVKRAVFTAYIEVEPCGG